MEEIEGLSALFVVFVDEDFMGLSVAVVYDPFGFEIRFDAAGLLDGIGLFDARSVTRLEIVIVPVGTGRAFECRIARSVAGPLHDLR